MTSRQPIRDRTTTPHESSTAPVVAIGNLTKRFGDVVAVGDVTFALDSGTVTGLVGPNGAGKTTTLRMLLGLAAPTSGEAHVFGHRYVDLAEPAHRVGAVLESDDFHPGRSGRDHLRIVATAARIPAPRIDDLLDLVALGPAARQPVRSYSLGMRQRLGLAGALLGDPELLVLDEPANGLDPSGVRWLRELLHDFARRGGTVLVSSHLLAELAQTVHRVVVITGGRVVADASLDELTRNGRSLEDAYVALTTGTAP